MSTGGGKEEEGVTAEVKKTMVKLNNEKKSLEMILKSSEKQVERLNEQVKRLQKENSDSTAPKDTKKLVNENQMLKTELDSFKARSEQLNKELATRSSELHAAKNQLSEVMANQEANAEANAAAAAVTPAADKSAINEDLSKSLQEKDIEIAKLMGDTKKMQDENKKMLIEKKKFEQKFKLLQGQLEKEKKRAAKSVKGNMGTSGGASTVKVKQLEILNQKLAVSQKKAMDDLNDKKKELIKMKQEMQVMSNELAALKRKKGAA